MYLFVTAGRGTETFVEAEVKDKLEARAVKVTDGKVFFDTDTPVPVLASGIRQLKTVERIFICILHKSNFFDVKNWKDKNYIKEVLKNISCEEWITSYEISKGCSTGSHEVTSYGTEQSVDDNIILPAAKNEDESNLYKITDKNVKHCHQQHENGENSNSGIKRRKLNSGDSVTFRVSCKVTGYPARFFRAQSLGRSLGLLLRQQMKWNPELKQPQIEICVHLNNQGLTVGLPLARKPLSERCYLDHIGLRTPVAYIMAHLAHITTSDVVLDPMCGSGTILIEAAKAWPSACYIGCDIDAKQLRKSAKNMSKSGESSKIRLICCNATNLPFMMESVDVVVSDLPFGQIHNKDEDMVTLYPQLLSSFHRVLRPGGRCVLLISEKLKDFVLKIVSGPRNQIQQNNCGGSAPEADNLNINQDSSATIVMETSDTPDNTKAMTEHDRRQKDTVQITWLGSHMDYVKLGETHAFICSFVKQ